MSAQTLSWDTWNQVLKSQISQVNISKFERLELREANPKENLDIESNRGLAEGSSRRTFHRIKERHIQCFKCSKKEESGVAKDDRSTAKGTKDATQRFNCYGIQNYVKMLVEAKELRFRNVK